MKDATKKLCERIAGIGHKDLTPDAIQRARQLFLDGLAVAVAGTIQEEPPSILAAHAKEMGGIEVSTVIGFGFLGLATAPVLSAIGTTVAAGALLSLLFAAVLSGASDRAGG